MNADNLQAVAAARLWLGTPYLHQGSIRGIGCDCLGLVRGVWRDLGGKEPGTIAPYRHDWMHSAMGEPLLDACARHCRSADVCLAGAILVFRWRAGLAASHVAIASGEDSMIHAHEGLCVAEVHMGAAWRRRIAGIFAFPEFVDGDL